MVIKYVSSCFFLSSVLISILLWLRSSVGRAGGSYPLCRGFDSPRVHQWHSDFIAMPQLCLPFGKHNFTLAQAKISPPKAISFALSDFRSFNFYVHSTFVFSPRKNRPKYGRFFVVWIYCFLLINALLDLLFFVEQCLVDIIAFC